MLGRLLNTLSYRLGRELRDWRKANPKLREDTWPWYQRKAIAAGKDPLRFPFRLFCVVLILSALAWSYHAYYATGTYYPPSPLPTLKQEFFTLWTVQATIAAMIYPIVIGFVTLLLQRRHSAKASLQIYLHDSTAILTGLSALFLVMAMGVQYFFINSIEIQVLTLWLYFDGIWFLANIVGVIWFLNRTFNYLRPERRADIVRAYVINHVWPAEIRRNLENFRFLRAIDYGWLPGPGYGDDGSNSNTAILIHSIGRDKGEIQVREKKKDRWFIRDVRFRLLSRVIQSWQQREEKLSLLDNDRPPDAIASLRHSRLLVFPYAPGEQFEAKYGLCRTEGGTGLRWWERLLVRWSFVLARKKKKTESLTISDILNGLIAEVQVNMEANEEVAYGEALEELVDMHAALIQAGNFLTDIGQRDNYANLVDRDHLFDTRLHDLWVRQYPRLIEATVERLPVNDTYFRHMVHVPGKLVSRLGAVRPIDIPSHFLHLSRNLHYRLNRWWSRTAEEQGLLVHTHCKPATLMAPAVTLYDNTIKEYVGAWETLKNNRFPPTGNEALNWEQYGDVSELYTGHLNSTLFMMFDSLILGNREGAEWLCDSLIKWWNTILFRFDDARYYIRDERKPTLELMEKPWETVSNLTDLSMPGVGEDTAQKALWAACIHNYWIDLCCVSLYAMIQFGKTCECESSLPAQLAGNLGKGKALRTGGETAGSHWPIQTLEELLIAIIRQYFFDGGYHHGYRARLDSVVEGIFSRGEPAMVPGRSYSVSGVEGLDALSDGQLVLMCLLIKEDWTPSERLIEKVQKWVVYGACGQRNFVTHLEQWRTRLNDVRFREYGQLFLCVQGNFEAVENLDVAASALNIGLGQISDSIERFQDEHLREAQVSEERLREVARWSSRSGFSHKNGDIPVSLFREVQHSDEEFQEYSQPFPNLNKGEYVEPPMAQRASNENEYFDRFISRSVAAHVMAETLKFLKPTTVDVETPLAYWEQIQIAASRIQKEDGTPILFTAGRGEPRWLLDWTRGNYDEDIKSPEGPRLVRDNKEEADGYVGSLNDIPVFVAPIGIGSSYLISREALDMLRFTKFEDGLFVRVFHESIQGNEMMINLRIVWRFELELRQSECWRLRYIKRNS